MIKNSKNKLAIKFFFKAYSNIVEHIFFVNAYHSNKKKMSNNFIANFYPPLFKCVHQIVGCYQRCLFRLILYNFIVT